MKNSNIHIERFVTGPIETNTYVVSNKAKQCLLIDPSIEQHDTIAYIKQEKLLLQAILITHGHFDHIMGIGEVIEAIGTCPVYIHPSEKKCLTDPQFNGSYMMGASFSYKGPVEELTEGNMHIGVFDCTVYHVPGHSPGGCAFLFEDVLLPGDIIFAGSVGRSDLPGGNGVLLVEGILQKLIVLPDETVVYPGHGNRTTIGREKRSNPYLR